MIFSMVIQCGANPLTDVIVAIGVFGVKATPRP